MKKIFAVLLALTLAVALLAGCAKEICNHRDIDDNGLCDACEQGYTDGTDVVPPHEHSFTLAVAAEKFLATAADEENAATYYKSCSCGEKGTETFVYGNPLCTHVDVNDNSICDKCGVEFEDGDEPACEHKDDNKNGKCDKCSEDYIAPEIDFSAYTDAFAATAPNGAVITVSAVTTGGDRLEGVYTVVYNADKSAVVTFSYDKLNTFTPGAELDELVSRVEGTATVAADGTVSGDIDAEIASVAVKNINLDITKIKYAEAVESGVLVVIASENLQSVLGATIDGLASDVYLAVTVSEGKVVSVYLSYDHATLGAVSISCTYN